MHWKGRRQFFKRRISNSQSPTDVQHKLYFDDSEEEYCKNKNYESTNQSELCANFVVREDDVSPNDDTSIYETLVESFSRHQISEYMNRNKQIEVDSVFLQG
jgi:hypothetical protein